jgi:hypothetical protein
VNVTWPMALFMVLLVLKLTGQIASSWWWVTAPLWATFLALFVVFGYIEFKKSRRR